MKKYLFFMLCFCVYCFTGCANASVADTEDSIESIRFLLKTNHTATQSVDKINTEDIASVEFQCPDGDFCLSATQTSKFLSLLKEVRYGKEIESEVLYGDRFNYVLYMRDGSSRYYDVIQWDEGGICSIAHTWYEAEPEHILMEIVEMETQLAEEFHKKFREERYYDLKGNGKRAIWYPKFRDEALTSCNDEIYEYVKQQMDKLDITRKMNVHLSYQISELDSGNVLIHFHGSVRYCNTWEFEEISFMLLCDTKEKRVIPYM